MEAYFPFEKEDPMGWADGLGQVLQNVLGGKASEADIHSAFDKVARCPREI